MVDWRRETQKVVEKRRERKMKVKKRSGKKRRGKERKNISVFLQYTPKLTRPFSWRFDYQAQVNDCVKISEFADEIGSVSFLSTKVCNCESFFASEHTPPLSSFRYGL